jgi:exodeoxyribonuclease VII large subunit
MMARRPFDPFRARGAPRDPGPPAHREQRSYRHLGEAEQLTVSELAQLIRTTVEQRIASPLRVIGQVSNLSARNHWYFSLKDDDAVVSCVAWASTAQKFGFVPNDGDEVVATGHVGFFPKNGRLQFYVSALVPLGAGALHQRFQAMCAELRDRGFFDPAHKKPVPAFPRRVAVITSAGGAAVHDVVATAKQRCPAVGLLIVDARVQGDGAAASVAHAIRWVDRHRARLGVDAILVTRGGGSMEDLWAFNELPVAEAAFACVLPLVAAIGHESDTTVIELVADERAATPTQAAMRLVPSRDELRQQIDHYGRRLDVTLRARIERERQRLRAVASAHRTRSSRGTGSGSTWRRGSSTARRGDASPGQGSGSSMRRPASATPRHAGWSAPGCIWTRRPARCGRSIPARCSIAASATRPVHGASSARSQTSGRVMS